MPPFFDLPQVQNAITARALPALERLAANSSQLDGSLNDRFGRDDPPPYVSSSESEEEEALYHPVLARSREAVLEAFRPLLRKPLDDRETRSLVGTLHRMGIYTPGGRYKDEARREHDRLDTFIRSADANAHAADLLLGPRGYQRRDIIVRRNIRKRWQRLGIWNPEWGIPGRVNSQPNDNTYEWKWKWQSTVDPSPPGPQHPISRAMQLRRNLAYGERPLPPPRSHLRHDSSASEAESFITSRPWFIWEIEKAEFTHRFIRIPTEQRGRPNPDEDGQVTKWWKERGDWEPGWKWRHESPSPEPEDLKPLSTDDMDFTPSEVDALEAIPPPSPPRLAPAPADGQPKWGLFGGLFDAPCTVGPGPAEPCEDAHPAPTDEPQDQRVPDAEEQPPNPPPRRGRRSREQAQPAEVTAAPAPPRSPPPLRRSARIAARNANPPPPPPPPPPPVVTARGTRARMPRAAAAAPPKKMGRPRKTTQDAGITKRSAPPRTTGGRRSSRTAAAAVAPAAPAASSGPKRRTRAAATTGRP